MDRIDPYAVIKDALQPLGVKVLNTVPPADRTNASFVVVTIDPGTRGARPGWVERVNVALEAWVGEGDILARKATCLTLALDARDALFEAWQTNRRTAYGAINHLPELPYPMFISSGLDQVWRARIAADVTIRR